MASVYRIKRKNKEEIAPAPAQSPELLTDLDLGTATAPKDVDFDSVEPIAEVTRHAVPEEVNEPVLTAEEAEKPAMQTQEFPAGNSEEAPAPVEADPDENTEILDKQEPTYDEELIRSLTEDNGGLEDLPGVKPGEIDFAKLDAVFGSARSAGSAASAAATDETASLLMQVFGDQGGKKKKKKNKNAGEPTVQAEEIQAVFDPVEAVNEAEEAYKDAENISTDEATEEAETESAEEAAAPEEVPAGETQSFSAIKPSDDNEYVAVHINEDEKTREYNASVKETLDGIEPEPIGDNAPPPVAEEFHVPDQESPYNDTYDELENNGKNRMDFLPEEYTSREQYDEFAEHMRNNNFRSLLSCLWLFILFGIVLYLESATFSHIYHPEFLQPYGQYNMIYLLLDVQLIFVSALFQLAPLGNGAKRLFTGKADRNSIVFLTMVLAAANAIAHIALKSDKYVLFGSVALLYSLLNGVARFLDDKRLYRSFRIAASRHTKFVGEEVAGDSAENEAFRELLPGEQKIYTVQRAELVEDFFKRSKKIPRSQGIYGWTIVLSFLISIGFAVYYYLKEGSASGTATAFMATAFMTMPLCGIFTQTLPFAHFSRKAEKRDAAIVSLAEAEDCSRASVVSFTDKEVFPARYVKVTTIRTYGETRIDKAILYAAMIFEKLGGPLSQVFKKTISGVVEEISQDFDFKEITADGMCASLEGQDVFVGNKDYMLSYDFGYPKDTMDDSFEDHSGKIMYMVIGTELAAKFYIRYSVSSRFKKTLVSLYKAGICPAVKTCDPNIDTNLLQNLLKSDKIPAGVIKTTDAMKDAPILETSQSGVVCTASIAGLLQTFVLSDSMVRTVRINSFIKILSLLVGAGALAFLYFTGSFNKADTIFVMLYQLLWLVPVFIPNLLA